MAATGPGCSPLLAGSEVTAPGAGADVGGTLASAFALLPGGGDGGSSAAADGRPLSPFSAGRFLPLSASAMARAASTPGPEGELSCCGARAGCVAAGVGLPCSAPSQAVLPFKKQTLALPGPHPTQAAARRWTDWRR